MMLAVALASGQALADRATEMKAREAFAAGRYEDALGLFAKLYADFKSSASSRHVRAVAAV